jgi:hypothetical protein
MIIVIKEQSTSDIITLSCVTSFDESYTGSVSSHPIESGSTITDHVTSDNDKFKVSGVVSDYDFLNPSKDLALEDVSLSKEGFPDASRSESTSRFANGLLDSGLIDVPDKYRAEYIKRRLIDIRKNSLLVTILEYPDSGELVQHTNCILTSLSFKEDENSGYAVYPDMAFEKINVVQVQVEEVNTSKIPKLSDSKVADAAAGTSDKGSTDVCHGRSLTQDYTYEGKDGKITVERGIARFYAKFTTASGEVTIDKEIPYPKEWPKWTDKCVLIGNEQEKVKKTGLDEKIDLNAKYKVAESLAKQAQAESREFGFVTKPTQAKLKAARDALNQPVEGGN